MCRKKLQLSTSGGCPQTDGQVERMNRTLKQILAIVVKIVAKNWNESLDSVLFAYRIASRSSGGKAPFSLVYGRDARVPTCLNFCQPVAKFTTNAGN